MNITISELKFLFDYWKHFCVLLMLIALVGMVLLFIGLYLNCQFSTSFYEKSSSFIRVSPECPSPPETPEREMPDASELSRINERLGSVETQLDDIKQYLQSSPAKPAGMDEPVEEVAISLQKDIVTEDGLRSYLADAMQCGDSRLVHYEFIRFEPTTHSLQEREKDKIKQFVHKYLSSDEQEKPNDKVKVFGFASPDGPGQQNTQLARERAKEVIQELKEHVSEEYIKQIDIGTGESSGEQHPINGIANSRSAVIAVCR